MKNQIIDQLVLVGYDRTLCLFYWMELDADDFDPAVAYVAIDSCFHHPTGVVSQWVRGGRRLGSAMLQANTLVNYIVEMRRRALKTRLDWPERRYEWTNQINRAKHYALKYLEPRAELS